MKNPYFHSAPSWISRAREKLTIEVINTVQVAQR
jgi:hypothetical protein